MRSIKIIIYLFFLLFSSCHSKSKYEKVPLMKYSAVYIGGLAGESLEFKPDSSFEYVHSTCLTRIVTGGKYSVINNSVILYDFEDLSKPLYTGSNILKDTFYLNFPSGRKIFSIKTDTIDFFQPYRILDKTPSKVMYSNKILWFFNTNGKIIGSLTSDQKSKNE